MGTDGACGLLFCAAYLRRKRGNDLGATMKYLRRTAIGAAGSGMGTKTKYLRRTTSGTAVNDLS
jgi:hypothetical protein